MAKKQNKKAATINQTQSPKTVVTTDAKTKVVKQNVQPKKSFNWFTPKLKLSFILAVIAFLVYSNTLKNGYVLDDSSAIAENSIVQKGTSAIGELFSTPYRKGFYVTTNDLYRPLSLVTFAIEYEYFGLNPKPNHFFNILLFAGCIIALFFFLDSFFEGKKTFVAFTATLLFALHPIHTEVVANVKSRDELLCFFFAFLALNVYLNYLKSGKLIVLLIGGCCFFLSFLSKESVITFLGVIPLVFFFYKNENRKRSLFITAMSVVVALLFLYIRFSVLSEHDANHIASIDMADNSLAAPNLGFESRLATAIFILGYYLRLLIVPYPLVCDYSYGAISNTHFSNIFVIITLIVYLFFAIFGIWGILKNRKNYFAFGILFFLITITLFSNIPFLIGATMGERFMFFGSVGFCIIVALLIEKFVLRTINAGAGALTNPIALVPILIISIIFAFITFGRNNDWVDNYTLYKNDVKKLPNATKLNYFYGLELQKTIADKEKDPVKQRQFREEGIRYFQKSIAIDSENGEAHANLGNAYFFLGMYDSAEIHEKKAILKNPLNSMTINNLSSVYYMTKRYRESLDLSKRAILLKPSYVNPYTNVGRCYVMFAKYDSAIMYVQQAISLDPAFTFSYQIMSFVYKALGKADSVVKYDGLFKKYTGK